MLFRYVILTKKSFRATNCSADKVVAISGDGPRILSQELFAASLGGVGGPRTIRPPPLAAGVGGHRQ
jgi:hypothetical protein